MAKLGLRPGEGFTKTYTKNSPEGKFEKGFYKE